MNRLIYTLTALLLFTGCKKEAPLQYQHSEKEQSISCNPSIDKLLNEALYSFEEDLKNRSPKEGAATSVYYGQFMYQGMNGSVDYLAMTNQHALEIRDALSREGILTNSDAKSNLNYEHPTVQCIITNIEDAAIKKTIQALIATNSMDPSLFDSRLRNFGRLSQKNRYQALYIALDAYYQRLIGISLDTKNE